MSAGGQSPTGGAMIRISLVEDDERTANEMISFFDKYAKEKGTEISVAHFFDALSFIKSYTLDCDAVFMDIELPGMDGMQAVKKLRTLDKTVAVVFVTNLAQYAVKGYSVHAFDFIVKPVTYYTFALKMNGLCEYLKKNKKVMIMISGRQGKRVVAVNELKYVEVNKHNIIYHTLTENIACSGTMKSVYEELKDLPFAFCNQSYLVNLRFCEGVSGNVLYLKDEELLISAPKRKDFLKELTRFVSSTRTAE